MPKSSEHRLHASVPARSSVGAPLPRGRRYTLRDFRRRFSHWKRLPFRLKLKRLFLFSVKLGFVGGLVLVIGGLLAYFALASGLPDPEKILERDLAQSTKIYDRTGTHLLYEIHGEEKRTVVSLSDIPKYVQQATLTTEDKKFYEHHGFSVQRIVVTLFTNVLQGKSAGASTITQQFIKNSILTPEKTYIRKIKELILAIQIERAFSKDQILELYLNEIPYGSNAYGVESAAQTYFSKSVKDVTLAEAAALAALPQLPTYYWNNPDEWMARKNYVLDEMARDGQITSEQAEEAKAQEIVLNRKRENIIAPHFILSYLRPYLDEKYGAEVVESGGLTVITTLDVNHQQWAEESIIEGKEKILERGGSNAAMVSIDTKTKQLLSMVGSFDYYDTEHGGQTNAANPPVPRSPGSSLKPVLYATAFEKGFTSRTRVWDLATDFLGSGKKWPHNFDFKERGPITLRSALQGSLNIPAVRLLYLVGFDAFYDNIEELGYTTFADRAPNLSIVIGGGGVRLVEHTYAFSILAREGEKHPLTSVLKVTDASGKVLEEWSASDPSQVLDRESIRELNSVLTDNAARAYIFGVRNWLTLPDRQVAAKTGTSSDNVDNWTMGYTPSLAAGVWVGNNDNTPMHRNADGSGTAAPIWNAYMRKATAGLPAETFKAPAPRNPQNRWLAGEIDTFQELPVDVVTGLVIPESCRNTYPSQYITTKQFKVTHNELHYIDLKRPNGPAPTNPESHKRYADWEAPVEAWARGQGGYLVDNPQYADCGLRDPALQPSVTIISPTESQHLTPETFDVEIKLSPGESAKITHVEYFIDENLVDSRTQSPWNTSYSAKNLTPGKHTLSVKATNSVGNFSSSSVSFLFDLPVTQTLRILTPKGDAVLVSGTESTITLSVSDATALSSIQVFEQRNGTQTLIQEISSPSENTLDVPWQTGVAGDVELYFVVTYQSGGSQTSERTNVTVTDPGI